MRARTYIRVSTDEQANEGYSLAAQEDRCRQFTQSQGWEEDGSYTDDGYSAKDLRRPGMQQMIKDVKSREFDVLVVYRLDRLVRSVMDLHYLLKLFDKYDVKFKSVTEVFDTTTATGRLFISIIGSLAQWERENLAERVKMGMERRALEGKRNGAVAPYGYDLQPDGSLTVNEAEAPVVRRIFEMYQDVGLPRIVEWLKTGGRKTKSGSDFGIYTVRYILTNPVYAGLLRWNHRNTTGKVTGKGFTYDGGHEPIITPQVFEQTQERMKRRTTLPPRSVASDYPFSGVLRCSRCGHPMVGYKRHSKGGRGGHYFTYRCNGRYLKKVCNMPTLSEKSVEEALFVRLKWFADRIQMEPPEEVLDKKVSRREEIERELEGIKKKRKKWQLAYAEDVITLDELRERTKEDRDREKRLQAELADLPPDENPQPPLTEDEFLKKINDLGYVWEKASRSERKELIHILFQELTVAAIVPKDRKMNERTRAEVMDFVFR